MEPARVDHPAEPYSAGCFDSALNAEVPVGTVVRRTPVLHPVRTLQRVVKGLLLRSPQTDRGRGDATLPLRGANDRGSGWLSRLLSVTSAAADDLFAIPDNQIGWLLPALSAGLSLVRQFRPRVIFSSGPPHSSHLIALLLGTSTRLPVVIDLRDPWARKNWSSKGKKGRRSLQQWLEHFCVKHSDRIILNTPALREEFVSAYGATFESKFKVIPNGYDSNLHSQIAAFREDQLCSTPDALIRLCHPGEIYGQRDLRPVIDAVHRLTRSGHRVRFEQIGAVENEAGVLSYVDTMELRGSVLCAGRQSHEETLRRMAGADAFVLSQPGTSVQIPGKLFEMLPFGRPIIALTDPGGATANLIEEHDLGFVVPPADSEAIAAAILRSTNGGRTCESTAGWQRAMKAFDGRELTRNLAGILDKCL